MRVAIIGLGSIGKRHLRTLRMFTCPSCKVDVVKRSGGILETDIVDMIDGLYTSIDDIVHRNYDRVIISSPSSLHLRDYNGLAETSDNFLIEKPLAATWDEGKKMIKIEKSHGHKTVLGYVYRFSKAYQTFKSTIGSADIPIQDVSIISHSYLPSWRADKHYTNSVSAHESLGGGVLRELSHEIDMLIDLFGFPVVDWSEIRRDGLGGIDVDQQCRAQLQASSGFRISLSLSMCCTLRKREMTVKTANGRLVTWDLLDGTVTDTQSSRSRTVLIPRDYTEMFERQLNHFVLGKTPDSVYKPASIDDGCRALELIEKIKCIGKSRHE